MSVHVFSIILHGRAGDVRRQVGHQVQGHHRRQCLEEEEFPRSRPSQEMGTSIGPRKLRGGKKGLGQGMREFEVSWKIHVPLCRYVQTRVISYISETVLPSRLHVRAEPRLRHTAGRLPQLAAPVQAPAAGVQQPEPARTGIQTLAAGPAVDLDQLQARLQQ